MITVYKKSLGIYLSWRKLNELTYDNQDMDVEIKRSRGTPIITHKID